MYPYAPASGTLTVEELSMRVAALERALIAGAEQAAGLLATDTNGKASVVDTALAAAPTAGQILTATSDTAAEWATLTVPTYTVDDLPDVGSLRTLGDGPKQACAGDDPRLSDDRDPTAHASTHLVGGADAISLPSQSSSGQVPIVPDIATSNPVILVAGDYESSLGVRWESIDYLVGWLPI